MSSKAGVLKFFEIAAGLSTGEPQIAEKHRAAGCVVQETDVSCLPLASILHRYSDREIHWLKIDVEGMEEEVLQGWLPSTVRPWVVVIESTLPNTQIPAHEKWEPQLIDLGYAFVYFDGLNRFYVSKARQDLKHAFRSGPNCFDSFALTETSPFCTHLNQKLGAQQEETQRLSQALAQSEREIGAIQAQLQRSGEETQRLYRALAERDREGETQANKSGLVYASLCRAGNRGGARMGKLRWERILAITARIFRSSCSAELTPYTASSAAWSLFRTDRIDHLYQDLHEPDSRFIK